jgi:hypothetical protein
VVGRGRRTSSLFRHRVVWFTERIDGGELSTKLVFFHVGIKSRKQAGTPL